MPKDPDSTHFDFLSYVAYCGGNQKQMLNEKPQPKLVKYKLEDEMVFEIGGT